MCAGNSKGTAAWQKTFCLIKMSFYSNWFFKESYWMNDDWKSSKWSWKIWTPRLRVLNTIALPITTEAILLMWKYLRKWCEKAPWGKGKIKPWLYPAWPFPLFPRWNVPTGLDLGRFVEASYEDPYIHSRLKSLSFVCLCVKQIVQGIQTNSNQILRVAEGHNLWPIASLSL